MTRTDRLRSETSFLSYELYSPSEVLHFFGGNSVEGGISIAEHRDFEGTMIFKWTSKRIVRYKERNRSGDSFRVDWTRVRDGACRKSKIKFRPDERPLWKYWSRIRPIGEGAAFASRTKYRCDYRRNRCAFNETRRRPRQLREHAN